MRNVILRRAYPLAGLVLLACGEARPTGTVTSVSGDVPASLTITPSPVANITVGSSVSLAAVVKSATGADVSSLVNWSSSNTAVATVSGGYVTGVSVGSAVVTASAGILSASVLVNVTAPVPPPPPATGETFATLPQAYVNSQSPVAPATGGAIIGVAAGGNLQAALNAAQPGDVIELANGATFIGNFILPNKSTTSTKWIVIRPANRTLLPAEGARMTPAIAAGMGVPKVISPNNQGAFQTAPGAHHYRLIGFEVTAPAWIANTGLVRLGDDGGNGQTTLASIPSDLVIDRMYIHGTAAGTVRRCVALNSASTAVVDSYLSECHDPWTDAQAIAGWNGPGPFKIVNNYLEGSGENVMFGGGDPGVLNLVPSDIEIRGNHIMKPLAWKGVWLIKNLVELKNAQRVLIEGNVIESNWAAAQGGSAIVMKTVNQSGTCTWCFTGDVTVRRNLIRNVGSGFNIAGSPDNAFADIHARRLTITDNVILGIDVGTSYAGDGRGVLFSGDPSDVVFAHNTIISPTNTAAYFGPLGTSMQRVSIRDNVMGGGQYGVKGDSRASGTSSITEYMPGGTFAGNVMVLADATGFPAGNYYPTSVAGIGFTNLTGGDVLLLASSVYKAKGTDGRDPGADANAVKAATASVIVP